MKLISAVILVVTMGPSARVAREEITVESLLREMADLERLTRPAEYTCKQFSSYDRACEKGDWYANNDCGNYLRVEKEGDTSWHVLADAEGPGAIVRIWSANPEGTIRIWLDGRVVIEEDFRKLTTGQVKPFVKPFGEETARGCTLYFPIPYARSMKVATSKGGQYYHVNYRTYPAETKIRTATRDGMDQTVLEEVSHALTLSYWGLKFLENKTVKLEIPPGAQRVARELQGPGKIVEFEMLSAFKTARTMILKLTFDDELCVVCPAGDFFGSSPGENPLHTLPMRVIKNTVAVCTYVMPFYKSAKVEFVNEGKEAAHVTLRLGVFACDDADKRLRFHAWWNGKKNLKTRPMSDWNLLKGEGKGRYVGSALYVRNPVKAWWGEGDEHVFVDGEKFPSWWGTGTEDYFGYAWCDPHKFHHAYHSQSRCDGPGNRGFCALNRWHILDDIPFTKSIQFDMEVWHWADCEMGYATVAYWYAEPGFKHSMKEAPLEEREIGELPEVKGVPGAQEGESLKILEKHGTVEPQDLEWAGPGWSKDCHLWWRDGKIGDVLRLEFSSEKEGKQSLILAMTKAKDYGIVKISVNGAVIDEKRDLYDPKVVPTGEIEYTCDLKKGANELKVEIIGTNEKADPKNYMFGLDYVRIK